MGISKDEYAKEANIFRDDFISCAAAEWYYRFRERYYSEKLEGIAIDSKKYKRISKKAQDSKDISEAIAQRFPFSPGIHVRDF